YTDAMKVELLGVPREILQEFTAVSAEAAEAMAAGARARTGATYGIAISGVAGPDGGSENTPVGTMFVALADAAGVMSLQRRFLGDRQRIRVFTTQMALDMLRRRLTA